MSENLDDNEIIEDNEDEINESITSEDNNEKLDKAKEARERAKLKAKLKQQQFSEQKTYTLKEGQKRYELKKWNSVGLWQWGKKNQLIH